MTTFLEHLKMTEWTVLNKNKISISWLNGDRILILYYTSTISIIKFRKPLRIEYIRDLTWRKLIIKKFTKFDKASVTMEIQWTFLLILFNLPLSMVKLNQLHFYH